MTAIEITFTFQEKTAESRWQCEAPKELDVTEDFSRTIGAGFAPDTINRTFKIKPRDGQSGTYDVTFIKKDSAGNIEETVEQTLGV